ncbi:MAG: methionyl-tRNA formyltransferase [Nitriliruptor sp.]|uniref:methionyl-tRNA formyltransferase n=1 Tax=Nitriliruptor sp. TaxID=2448056 RepID=UPI0034A068AD
MRILFLGTPDVAVPALDALVAADDVEVVAVVTNPDRPKGRSKQPVPPPVKVAAERHGLPVWQPVKAREIVDDLAALDVDACAIVAYGALLPRSVLDVGGRGFVNLHFSLLPRWRGAAPVQHAIRAGDEVTGVTCFVLDEGMDTGPVLATAEEPIRPDDTSGSLLDRLADVGAPVLLDALRRLVAGEQPVPQPTDGSTLAPKVNPQDAVIDWSAAAGTVTDLVRSADPAPGAHTTFRDKRLKIWRTTPVDEVAGEPVPSGAPGEVVAVTKRAAVVACGGGAVQLDVVQPEGKGRVDAAAFVNGQRPELGERLGA